MIRARDRARRPDGAGGWLVGVVACGSSGRSNENVGSKLAGSRAIRQRWQACSPYLYGIDLFNHGYYWEAHEVWEGLWRACGRSGPAGTFLKALIGLAAAGFKVRVGNLQGVRRHAQRAARLFHETAMVIGPHGPSYMGLDLRALKRWASDVAECPPMNGDYGSRRETVVFGFALWPV